MKRILFLFFLVNSLFVKSQTILSDTVIGINCYHDGSINLVVDNINNHTLTWFFQDENGDWIEIDPVTMSGFQLSSSADTIFTTICGNFKVEIYNSSGIFISSTQMDWLDCSLGINPSHDNIKCFGDSTGELKRIAHSGSSPYSYEWFHNGTPFSSGNNDTLHENLGIGEYSVVITDSEGCQDSIITTIAQPMPLDIELIILVRLIVEVQILVVFLIQFLEEKGMSLQNFIIII